MAKHFFPGWKTIEILHGRGSLKLLKNHTEEKKGQAYYLGRIKNIEQNSFEEMTSYLALVPI